MPIRTSVDNSGAIAQLQRQLDSARAQLRALGGGGGSGPNSTGAQLSAMIQALSAQIRSLQGYRSGTDWTGSGSPSGIAGFVHNREAVLNERGTRIVGSEFVNAANQGRNPWQYAPTAPAATRSSGPSIVVLDQAQYLGLVDAMAASGGQMPSASTLQGVVNALNSRTGDLGGK